jgi:hypothetical protein
MGGAGKFGSMKGGYHFSFMCDAPFTLRNYAGRQIERCAHQSRDERNLLERILIFILISMMLVGDIPLSLRIFCKKRGSACRRSEFIFLSRAGGRRFFGRMGAWRLRRNSDQQGGYHPPTEQHAKVRCWPRISSRAFAVRP